MQSSQFKDQVVLITGASRGIGRAAAIAFAEQGARVVVNYKINLDSARETLKMMKEGDHLIFGADVSKTEEVEKMFDEVIRKYKRLDVLVNNAGICMAHPIDDVSFESFQHAWDLTIQTNLTAVANTSFLAAKQMIRQGGGRIVNVSSRGAFRGEPNQPAYGASKAGVNSLSQSLAKQLGKHNIFVMAVAPGFVETDMGTETLTDEERLAVEKDSPMQRMAKAEEVANAILYLASEESAFSTGAILDINGASYLRT